MSVSDAVRASAERLVVAATMGPTLHDVHAWRLKVVPGRIEVHADPGRYRPDGDPVGRVVHLRSGAALVNLRLAAAQLGHEAVVRLLPDAGRPSVLASVRLAGRHRVTRLERLLYAATLRPFVPREPPSCARPPASLLSELAEAVKLEGASLHPLPVPPDSTAQRAVLTTFGDSPAQWIRAGQALQRLLLTGIIRGASVSFRTEPGVPAVEDVTRPGEVPHVLVSLTCALTAPRLLKTPVAGKHEGQRHPYRVGQPG